MYSGPGEPYRSNIPPWHIFAGCIEEYGMEDLAQLIRQYLS